MAGAIAKWKTTKRNGNEKGKKNYFLKLKEVRVSGRYERDGVLSTMEFISENVGDKE